MALKSSMGLDLTMAQGSGSDKLLLSTQESLDPSLFIVLKLHHFSFPSAQQTLEHWIDFCYRLHMWLSGP